MSSALELAPEPRSVRAARAWIVGQLTTIGRTDLVDAAELGVSELVTNALLHADPPIVVRLGGTPTHPRVEVHDNSVTPPRVRDMTTDARLMATVGRGLGIVSMYSTTWGAEVSEQGKVVWFEPATEPDSSDEAEGVQVAGDVFDLSGLVDDLVAAAGEPSARVTVCLLGMPVRVFAAYRNWYEEVRRELRLLALNHGVDYPLALELTDLTLRVEQERRQSRGVDVLEAALATDDVRVDLEYQVPVSAPATMTRLRELLEQVDVFCREQRLLTLSPSPQQLRLRTWYLGEFASQARGQAPTPWPGGYAVEDTPR
jgi:anti-sigma regulatory factor (Ser/Thr protein kinase)